MNWMGDLGSPFFLLIALAAPAWVFLVRKRERSGFPTVPHPAVYSARAIGAKPFLKRLRDALPYIKAAAVVLLAVALARPRSVSHGQNIESEGIDIVIALDISASMLAQDFRPDRVGAAKAVAAEFVSARPNDRIGMVLFGKYAFTQCPLTVDHSVLLELIDQVQVGLADPDRTAIGQAIGAALNRIKASQSKSKVVILLTDGENNFGLPPVTAAEAAEALGVRIYTIGVGSRGTAPYPARDLFGRLVYQQVKVSIDEDLLRRIAEQTGGKYFRATDESKLREIFSEIDRLEKTRTEVRAWRRYRELFYPWAAAALALLVLTLTAESWLVRSLV